MAAVNPVASPGFARQLSLRRPGTQVPGRGLVQHAAQHAVDSQWRKAMMVVIKPSTGEILAVAQHGAAHAAGDPEGTDEYPCKSDDVDVLLACAE